MIIYKVKNKISGKVYIGQSVKTLEYRKNMHIQHSKTKNTHFYNALRSYGADNFEWDIIDTATTKDELNQKEKQYIQKYNSIEEGYNMVEGGSGGYNEYAIKANKKKKGKLWEDIYSLEGLKVMREVAVKFGEIGSSYTRSLSKEKLSEIGKYRNRIRTEMGYTHSDETKKKISEAQKGITFEDRYGVDGAEVQRQIISQKTKEAMKKVDWDSLMEKALKGRKVYWDNKHSTDKDRILELKVKGYKIKHICAELDISTPTYYKRVRELENEGKI